MSRGPIDRRLLRHARAGRAGVAVLALLGAGQAVATLVVAVALTAVVAGGHAWGIWLLLVAYGCRAALALRELTVARTAAARATGELRHAMLRALPGRGPAWVAQFGAGRLTHVLTGGLDALRPWFAGYLPSLILGVLLPPLVIVAMAVVDPASALIALLTLPLIPVLGALIGWATEARARRRWQADARLAGHFLDVVRGLPTLRMYGRASRQTAVVAGLTDEHRAATLRVLRVAFLSSTALDLVGTLSVGLIAVETGLRVAAGHMPLGPALLVILLAPEAYRPLRDMAARYHAATDATAAIADVDEVLTPPGASPAATLPPGAAAGPEPTTLPPERAATSPEPMTLPAGTPIPSGEPVSGPPGTRESAPSPAGLVATGLSARYPGATTDALALPSLTVAAGEVVALRGPSGAGKTTALRVLAGLHPAAAGGYTVENAVYLPQRPTLPHARTVADLFEPAGDIPAALAVTGLDNELTASTPLGEHGAGVSAGQRQRLALAALLHRARGATLLLDEPTAHLDPATERLVIARLREAAAAGCAILVVAHRPVLLAAADRIVDLTPPSPDPTPTPTSHAAQPATDAVARPVRQPKISDKWDDKARIDRAERNAEAGESRAHTVVTRPANLWAAVALGSGASLAGLLLTAAAAWLLVRAAALPPVLSLSAAVVLVRASAVARPLLRYLERLVAHDVAFARLAERRARVYAALIPRVPGPRLRRRGDLLTRVVDDVDAGVDGLLRGRLAALAAAVTVAIAAVAAVRVAPAVAAPICVGLLTAAVLAPATACRQAAREDEATASARARLRDAMVETVAGIEELPGAEVPERRSDALATLEIRAARAAGRAAALGHLGWGIAVAGTAYALQHTPGMGPEWMAVVLLAVVALGEPIRDLPDAAVARRRATGAAERLATLTAEPLSVTFPGSAHARAGLHVSVRGLTAGWDPGRAPALRDFDLDLPPGSRVAITGRSGSGKSTLGAVLARFLDPREGTITIDGQDVRALPEAAVRGRIVLVGEDTDHVFASTVRENLRLARPEATDDELRAVLHEVRLDGWLDGQTHGLDTWLGTGGSTMSGGQARRFATARALLADPALLILDEPTEGLDQETATAVMTDLLDAASGRTVLVLTHRLEGRFDRIVELSEAGGRTARPSIRSRALR